MDVRVGEGRAERPYYLVVESVPIISPAVGSAVLMVTRWYVADGVAVVANAPVCELEIAFVYAAEVKVVTRDLTAPVCGVLRHAVRAGGVVGPGDEIAHVTRG